MFNFFFFSITFFLSKNFFFLKYLKHFVIFYSGIIFFFLVFFALVLIYLIYIKYINTIFSFLFFRKEVDLYFYNKYDYLFSFLLILIFFFYYFFYLRILIFFIKRNLELNFFDLKNNIFYSIYDYSLLSGYNFFYLIILFIIVVFILFLLFSFFFKLNFFFFKKNFLKLHYYSFCRSQKYTKIIFFFKKNELLFFNFLGLKYYRIYVILRSHLFKIIIIIIFFKCLIFDCGNLFFFLKILPFYGLYNFLLNVYNYILYIFNHDFDILVMESYYKDIFFHIEIDEIKKREYKKFLLLEVSNFKFQDSIYLEPEFKEEKKENYMLIQTYKYSENKYPNDFFTRIRKKKPKFPIKL